MSRPGGERKPVPRLHRSLVSVVLVFEGMVLFFAGLVAREQSSLGPGTAIGLASALAVVCVLACGLLSRRWGFWAGGALQLAVIGFGYWVPTMYFLGAVFAALYLGSLYAADYSLKARARLEAELADQQADRQGQAANGPSDTETAD
jgi:hypothetical protein